jgi:hypothetical protein
VISPSKTPSGWRQYSEADVAAACAWLTRAAAASHNDAERHMANDAPTAQIPKSPALIALLDERQRFRAKPEADRAERNVSDCRQARGD